jgi:cytochrome P450
MHPLPACFVLGDCLYLLISWLGVARRAYLQEMLMRVFGPSALNLSEKLRAAAAAGTAVNMEASFSQLTLDVIGKAVFNYDFDSLNQ